MTTKNQLNCLKPGCYLILFRPAARFDGSMSDTYIGTLRVNDPDQPSRLPASGDLYLLGDEARKLSGANNAAEMLQEWEAQHRGKKTEIPIFRMQDYQYYLEVKAVQDLPNRVRLSLQGHKFDPLRRTLVAGGAFEIELKPVDKKSVKGANGAKADSAERLTGRLLSGNEQRGELALHWISKDMRRAAVRLLAIQSKSKSNKPIRFPGQALPKKVPSWQKLFGAIHWQLSVEEATPDKDLTLAPQEKWTPFDLGLKASELRKGLPAGLGHDWVYDLLCVSKFDHGQFLGMMFDSEATDLNGRPRESAAVAALETITIGEFKDVAQDAFGGRLYYRTALHELGHAMNLTHTLLDDGIMNTTNFLLPEPPPPGTKKRITDEDFQPEFVFSPKDREWLQHAPDIAIRPGGISRNEVGWLCECKKDVNVVALRNEPQIELTVEPLLREVAWGAPVRLNYSLINHGLPIHVPPDISLRPGLVSGRVTGPDRRTRYFRSLFRCCDALRRGGHLEMLTTEKPINSGMTLLRGTQGALFPSPGVYGIELELRWDENGRTNRVLGSTTITIQEPNPTDPEHQRAAEVALNEPLLMPPLVEGLLNKGGLPALSLALHSKTLAPHYLVTALICRVRGEERNLNWSTLFGEQPSLEIKKNAAKLRSLIQAALKSTRSSKVSETAFITAREREILRKFLDSSAGARSRKSGDDALSWLVQLLTVTHAPTDEKLQELSELLAGLLQQPRPAGSQAGETVGRSGPSLVPNNRGLQPLAGKKKS